MNRVQIFLGDIQEKFMSTQEDQIHETCKVKSIILNYENSQFNIFIKNNLIIFIKNYY